MNKPKWYLEIIKEYKRNIYKAFFLYGNIGDYVYERTLLRDFLIDEFSKSDDPKLKKDRIYLFDIHSGGIEVIKGQANLSLDDVINEMNKQKGNSVFIFYYPEYIIPAGDFIQPEDKRNIVALHNVLNSHSYILSNNITFFVTESLSGINSMFLGNNSKCSMKNIELPDWNSRLAFVKDLIFKKRDVLENVKWNDVNFEILCNLTSGLQYFNIEDILIDACYEGEITANIIAEKKKEIIQKEFGEIIEIFDTDGYSLEKFAGQDDIKSYFRETVIDAIKRDDLGIVPKGVMFMGPPGTGKTYFAKCLAGDSGINFVEFKMSKILGKYVGESEKAMEKALSVFRALAPVGVFMDEIDQSMTRGQGGSDGGSRVNANIFGMLLSEMSNPENRGKIIWIAATNYPNNVDEALKRSGRFDKKMPFFAPTEAERESVFKLHLDKADLPMHPNVDIKKLAKATEGYTQAEIEAIVVKALELSKRAKQKVITQDKLDLALGYMLSNQNVKIREMEDIALRECNDQEFIPENYKERHRALLGKVSGVSQNLNRM